MNGTRRLAETLACTLLTLLCAPAAAYDGAAPRRMSVDVKDADIHNVLRLFADVSRRNIIVSDRVQGRVTVKLRYVPWNEALNVVLRSRGLGSEEVGNVIHVDTLQAIAARSEAKARIAENRKKLAPLRTVLIPLNYAKATDIKPLIEPMLTDRGRVAIDPRTNTLIVTDVAYRVEAVRAHVGPR